ncbi:MAG: hypothetical protein JKX76_02490 [Colwellia sp.]|nr:hypothetical protein [Colwellia sp.]
MNRFIGEYYRSITEITKFVLKDFSEYIEGTYGIDGITHEMIKEYMVLANKNVKKPTLRNNRNSIGKTTPWIIFMSENRQYVINNIFTLTEDYDSEARDHKIRDLFTENDTLDQEKYDDIIRRLSHPITQPIISKILSVLWKNVLPEEFDRLTELAKTLNESVDESTPKILVN